MPPPGKRQAIIDAAIRLLATKGSAGLTASALAAEAGMSKANVFHHFETLDDIVLASFEQTLLGMEAFTPPPGTSLHDWLLALGDETVALMDEQRLLTGAYLGFVARAQSDTRLRQRMAETAAKAEAGFAATIRQLAPKRFTPAKRRALAALILIAGDGLAIHRHLFPERSAPQRAAWRSFVNHIAPEEDHQ
jgi:AcrR family transcriptional regulator